MHVDLMPDARSGELFITLALFAVNSHFRNGKPCLEMCCASGPVSGLVFLGACDLDSIECCRDCLMFFHMALGFLMNSNIYDWQQPFVQYRSLLGRDTW